MKTVVLGPQEYEALWRRMAYCARWDSEGFGAASETDRMLGTGRKHVAEYLRWPERKPFEIVVHGADGAVRYVEGR